VNLNLHKHYTSKSRFINFLCDGGILCSCSDDTLRFLYHNQEQMRDQTLLYSSLGLISPDSKESIIVSGSDAPAPVIEHLDFISDTSTSMDSSNQGNGNSSDSSSTTASRTTANISRIHTLQRTAAVYKLVQCLKEIYAGRFSPIPELTLGQAWEQWWMACDNNNNNVAVANDVPHLLQQHDDHHQREAEHDHHYEHSQEGRVGSEQERLQEQEQEQEQKQEPLQEIVKEQMQEKTQEQMQAPLQEQVQDQKQERLQAPLQVHVQAQDQVHVQAQDQAQDQEQDQEQDQAQDQEQNQAQDKEQAREPPPQQLLGTSGNLSLGVVGPVGSHFHREEAGEYHGRGQQQQQHQCRFLLDSIAERVRVKEREHAYAVEEGRVGRHVWIIFSCMRAHCALHTRTVVSCADHCHVQLYAHAHAHAHKCPCPCQIVVAAALRAIGGERAAAAGVAGQAAEQMRYQWYTY
jgi:hypothetical protein